MIPKTMQINIKLLHDYAQIPTKSDPESAMYDLYCPPTTLGKGGGNGAYPIPLGIAIEIPRGYHAEVYPRSSTCLKYNVILANSVGIIDSGYLDEWVLLIQPIDWTDKDYDKFNLEMLAGGRLAQFQIVPNGVTADFNIVKEFDKDSYNRGGGLGHSGK